MTPARHITTGAAARRHHQHGQSSMEYVLLCAALVFVLGIGMVDDQSVLRQLLQAFVLAYQKISFAIALP